MKKPRIRTMDELSTEIGISRPTLSKFFQNPDSVSKTTRSTIETGLQRVDYVPNFFATRMNRKSTGLIGVIVPYLSDLYYTSLIQAMESEARKSDYMVITQSAHGDPKLEARAAEKLLAMSVDGVIIAPMGHPASVEFISRINAEMPIVFVDSRFPGEFQDVDFVGTDNQRSISLIVDYLCRSGEPPVFLPMPRFTSNSLEREEAYLNCAERLGFTAEIVPDGGVKPSWEFEHYASAVMERQFSAGKFVSRTILCANDRLAIGAIQSANRLRLISYDRENQSGLRIAGHDDYPLSAFVNNGLTTVSRNPVTIGKAAVEQVVAQIQHGKRESKGVTRMVKVNLCPRGSA